MVCHCQEERESKKLRRKQSNRESARRSRQRKQAESQALTSTVSELQQENLDLKAANKAMLAQIEGLLARLDEVCLSFVTASFTILSEVLTLSIFPIIGSKCITSRRTTIIRAYPVIDSIS